MLIEALEGVAWGLACATCSHMRLPSTAVALAALLVLAGVGAGATGCASTMMTPAQMAASGARPYEAHDAAALVRASATALETLGFEVVVEDAAAGKVVTKPRTVVIKEHAPIAIAWSVEVEKTASGPVVHAQPQYSKSGAPVAALDAPYVKASMSELFDEIDASLPAATETTSARMP
ncbi:MAG: hypothetical protein JWP87_4257 [Labilithrix sp.]|nr:hypothetical protein [Labilithrix sp.]